MYFKPFLSLPERQNTLQETFRILEEKYGVVITVLERTAEAFRFPGKVIAETARRQFRKAK